MSVLHCWTWALQSSVSNCLNNHNNHNNEYLEHLTCTGPKRLHVLYKHILSKFNAYNTHTHTNCNWILKNCKKSCICSLSYVLFTEPCASLIETQGNKSSDSLLLQFVFLCTTAGDLTFLSTDEPFSLTGLADLDEGLVKVPAGSPRNIRCSMSVCCL